MYYTILYTLMAFMGRCFPLPLLYWIARRTAEFRYIIQKDTRKIVQQNIRIVLDYKKAVDGISYTEKELNRLVKNAFYNFGIYLADFFYIPRWNKKMVEKKVRIENIQLLDEYLKSGNGVIALTGHIGNWELSGVVASILGYKVTAVAIPYLNMSVTGICKRIRNSRGLEVILTGENPKKLLKTLKENRVLAVLGDRVFTEKGMRVKFLGIDTVLPRGPATLSIKTNTPLVAGFLVREGGKYRFFFQRIPMPPSSITEEEKIDFLVSQGAKVIERVIINYPDQWLNFTPVIHLQDNPSAPSQRF
ncbi:MAG: lysophospholipid acyltransferase family protein [Candidatus Omnitrophica bacterium]|nr:lysophospholipid acyltransferase family protein [Candidatus Omnitrophota bacterium]